MHITDFNIATMLTKEVQVTTIAGTKPYMGKNRRQLRVLESLFYGFDLRAVAGDMWSPF